MIIFHSGNEANPLFQRRFVFETLFHRELPVLNWLTEEKQIMQL